ncbi:hypothetical protein HK096_004395, partial [Nowakowskiella sp. JEL0078]
MQYETPPASQIFMDIDSQVTIGNIYPPRTRNPESEPLRARNVSEPPEKIRK